MKFHMWINAAQDHDATIDVPVEVLRRSSNPVVQAYLDWVEATGQRRTHAGEGATKTAAIAAYYRGEGTTE